MKRFVIIGNGVAAIGCVEGLRSVDKESAITIVSAEDRRAYCRPLISYYLEGRASLNKIDYRDVDFYQKNQCDVLFGVRATQINQTNRIASFDNGERLSYDAVCIAAGSSPFVPPMKGLETVENACSFMTLDDALALEKMVDSTSRVLIVGAGLIGLKCAEGLRERVASITVCDLAPRVLSSVLDDECAARMQQRLEEHGLKFYLGDSVAQFNGNCATMTSGAVVEFDVLVLAVGVRANIGLAREIGCECGRAIRVDKHMRSSVENVYAAGDCTESFDASSGETKVMALLPNAYQQGYCAGRNMGGLVETLETSIPMNSIGFWGLHAITAGTRYSPEDGGGVYIERDADHIKNLYHKAGKLTGFMLIGDVARAGVYCSLIRNQTPLDAIDFESIKRTPGLAAFPEEQRRHILGELV